jgi:uncharacterized protein YifE (UPF0438 family)
MKLSNIDNVNVYGDDKYFKPEYAEYTLDPKLVPLISKLAKKMLGVWEFKATQKYRGENEFDSVDVLHDGQDAGSIYLGGTYRRRGRVDVFELTHHSIKKERGSANTIKTSKEDAAYRLVRKHFGAKSLVTVMREHHEHLKNVLSSNSISTNVAHAMRNLDIQIAEFITSNEETFLKTLVSEEERNIYEHIEKTLNKYNIVRSVKHEDMVVVRVDGNKLYAQDMGSNDKDIVTYADDDSEIPEFMRRKLGMLKLVENGHVIKDVGIKINDNVFGITPEETSL